MLFAMDGALELLGSVPYSDVDAALIPSSELATYYDGRFRSFEDECVEHVELIGERRCALRTHHSQFQAVDSLRKKVALLQRRLAEVEVQSAKERVRALRLDSEHKDLHISRREHRDEIRRLLASAKSSPSPSGSKSGGAPGASRCLMRSVETPGGVGEELEAPADVWLQIREDVSALTHELVVFDAARAERCQRHRDEVTLLEAQHETELAGLLSERERMADSLLSYMQLRSEHLTLQREHAAEMEVLKSCNCELVNRTEELSHKGRQSVKDHKQLSKIDAAEHTEYRRIVEVIERQHVGVARAGLEDVCQDGEARVAELESETRALKNRCSDSRRQRKLALDGLRADLSLVARKLAVLEEVSAQVNGSLGKACCGAEAAWAMLGAAPGRAGPQACADPQAVPLRQGGPSTSPYASRRLGSTLKPARRCNSGTRESYKDEGLTRMSGGGIPAH